MSEQLPTLNEDEVVDLGSVQTELPAPGASDWVDPDDEATEKDFKASLKGDTHPQGDYVLMWSRIRSIEPVAAMGEKKGRPGGKEVTFKIVQAPPNVTEPPDGWPEVRVLFKKYDPGTATEGQKNSQRIDKKKYDRALAASGFEATGDWNRFQVGKTLCELGAKVLATAKAVRETATGDYQDWDNFRPVGSPAKK